MHHLTMMYVSKINVSLIGSMTVLVLLMTRSSNVQDTTTAFRCQTPRRTIEVGATTNHLRIITSNSSMSMMMLSVCPQLGKRNSWGAHRNFR